jgi:hypothetical protein
MRRNPVSFPPGNVVDRVGSHNELACVERRVEFLRPFRRMGRVVDMTVPGAHAGIGAGQIVDAGIFTDHDGGRRRVPAQPVEHPPLVPVERNGIVLYGRIAKGYEPHQVVKQYDGQQRGHRAHPQERPPNGEQAVEQHHEHRRREKEQRSPVISVREVNRLHRPHDKTMLGQPEHDREPDQKQSRAGFP